MSQQERRGPHPARFLHGGNRTTAGAAVTSSGWADCGPEARALLATLLGSEGLDLMTATTCDLVRGTPVYVSADAELSEVQSRMARHHIRLLPVLQDGALIGMLDLVELARAYDGSGRRTG